jgi:hypothetical protein
LNSSKFKDYFDTKFNCFFVHFFIMGDPDTVPKSLDLVFKPPLIKDALLAYLVGHDAPLATRKKAVLGFFKASSIAEAKKKLYDAYPSELGTFPKRKGSQANPKNELHLADICDALVLLDAQEKTPDVVVPASALGSLPPSLEEVNPTLVMLERMSAIEELMTQMTETNANLHERIRSLERCQYEKNSYSAIAASGLQQTTLKTTAPAVSQAPLPPPPPRPPTERVDTGATRDEWQTQRSRKRAPALRGKATGGKLKGAPPPPRHIFLYRVEKEFSSKDVVEHIREATSDVKDEVKVELLSHQDAKYKSFKVTCSAKDFPILMDENVWPEGSNFRQFKNYRQRDNQQRPDNRRATDEGSRNGDPEDSTSA